MQTENLPIPPDQIRALLLERLMDQGPTTVPTSAAQRRLWFIDQLSPNTPRYNIPSVVWLTGDLNISAMEKTLAIIVERHEVLRARFDSDDGEPAQIIQSESCFKVRVEDLSSLPVPKRDQLAKTLIEEEVKRPFQLDEGPLIRATILRVNPQEHVLIINMHHIASDEWSYKLFYRELQTLYTGLAKGQVPTLPELPIQYSDYAAWETEYLQTDQFQEQLQYWKEHLAGNPPEVKLPADRPRVPKENPKGAVEVHFLPPELAKDLRTLGVAHNATLFMVLLAAFKALLHRLTNQHDIIVGSPMAGRNQVETEHIIGFFANTLPLRTQITPQMTFLELLVQIRKTVVGAFSNQDVPFEKIVEALQPPRTPGRTPFINVLFLFQTDLEGIELPGLKTTFLDTNTDTAKFDITLFIADSEEALVTGIEYNTEMFDPDTIKGLLLNLAETLQVIIRNPSQQLSNLPNATIRNNTQLCATIPDQKKSTPPPWEFLEKWFAQRQIS